MIINHRRTGCSCAEVGEPHVVRRQAALLCHIDTVLKTAEISVNVVGAISELYPALFGLPDYVLVGNQVPGTDLQGYTILLHDIQDLCHPLGSPHLVEPVVKEVWEEESVGEYVRRFVGQNPDRLIHNQIHIFLVRQSFRTDLLVTVNPGDTAFLVHDCHSVREQVVESPQRLRGEISRPFTALTLNSAQERHIFHLVEIFINLLIVGQHPAHSARSRIWGDSVIDTIIHAHGVGHLGGEATFKMDMPVDHREILLLELDGPVSVLVNRRKGVTWIGSVGRQLCKFNIPEPDGALASDEADSAMAETHLLILRKSQWMSRFRVTDHIHALYLHRDVLPPHRHLERSPLTLFLKRPVEITNMKEGTALDCPVYRTAIEKHLITASGTIVVKRDAGRGTWFRLELTTQHEIGVITLELVAGSLRNGHFLAAAGNQGQRHRRGSQPGNTTDCSHCLFVVLLVRSECQNVGDHLLGIVRYRQDQVLVYPSGHQVLKKRIHGNLLAKELLAVKYHRASVTK